MSDSQFNIQDFIHELSDIPLSDQLVSLNTEKTALVELEKLPTEAIELDQNEAVKAILKTAQSYRKEADVNSLCVVQSVIRWTVDGAEQSSPLFLFPADWNVVKHNQRLKVEVSDTFELNPYVKRVLRNWTGDSLQNWDSLSAAELEVQLLELKEKHDLPLNIEPRFLLGNFHYHRYHILRELEGIERSQEHGVLISELLGSATEVEPLNISSDILTPVDVDQLNVFQTFSSNNVVVQGPPGTGKSQVLINVLGKLLATGKRTLVVSEKKVALEVLVKKLSDLGLNPFTFIVHSQTKSKDFIQQLKETWLFLENHSPVKSNDLKLSEQRLAQLQLLLDRLNSTTLIGGVSFTQYQELLEETPTSKATFLSDVPSIADWLNAKENLQQLNQELGALSVLGNFKPAFFRSENGDVLLQNLAEQLNQLKLLLGDTTFANIRTAFESLGRCRLVENEWYKGYSKLLDKPKEWKKFERNRLRFSELESELTVFETENQIWKQAPSATQISSWEAAVSFWEKRKRNRAMKAMLLDASVQPELAIANWKKYTQLSTEKRKLDQYFLELGLPNSTVQLEAGAQFARHIRQETEGVLAEVASWPTGKRKKLLKEQQLIEEVYHQLNRYFEVEDSTDITQLISDKRKVFESLLPSWKLLQELAPSVIRLATSSGNWQEMQAQVILSNWRKTEAFFPELARFDGKILEQRLEQTIADQDNEMALFAGQLLNSQKALFDSNEALLLKPSQKCTAEEKVLRARLKKGKALLVREFGKSRTHTSIRELLDSDAEVWIQSLIPIWLATPTQVADHFPLKTNLFDVVVFDEASQIPLPNAFGALFRSKRALVAGDEQQMSPTSYFGKSWSGHDLLHQASFYFKRVPLKHHYRSAHPELISFSNKHFYGNELVVYPSAEIKQVVFRHRCEGKFIDRKNTVEAKAVAEFLENYSWKKTIGIVAFSEEQLKAIWAACSSKVQEAILLGQEKNTVFFKTLEQVQGDEAQCMAISMGYAPNEENKFHLRFGPLNQANGYKRLNVLLTRAINEMHFFTSVDSNSFTISANESMNLLRKFLHDLEETATIQELQFPYELRPRNVKKNNVHFPSISNQLQNAVEFITFHRVMKHRGWILNYYQ